MSINPYSIYDADMAAYGVTESPYTSTAGSMSAYQGQPKRKQTQEHFEERVDEDSWSAKDKACPGKKSDSEVIFKIILFIMLITFVAYAYVSTLLQVTSLTEKVNMLQSQLGR
jgi:hypothetical protein